MTEELVLKTLLLELKAFKKTAKNNGEVKGTVASHIYWKGVEQGMKVAISMVKHHREELKKLGSKET